MITEVNRWVPEFRKSQEGMLASKCKCWVFMIREKLSGRLKPPPGVLENVLGARRKFTPSSFCALWVFFGTLYLKSQNVKEIYSIKCSQGWTVLARGLSQVWLLQLPVRWGKRRSKSVGFLELKYLLIDRLLCHFNPKLTNLIGCSDHALSLRAV